MALAAPASASVESIVLPEPTGPFAVGVRDFHLTDSGRADPWVPAERRELMVSAWYPAMAGTGARDSYATPEESALTLARLGAPGVPADSLTRVVPHARVSAPMVSWRLPTVVLSPGFAMPRASLTGLAEDLASRGYLVLGVDHTYEAAAVTFPDGRVAECLACDLRLSGPAVTLGRAADVSFVLDELSAVLPMDGRIIAGGHSVGGASAIPLMAADDRVRGGFDLDGSPHQTPSGEAASRPFLLMGTPSHAPDGKYGPEFAGVAGALTGWKRWITVDGTAHASFTDYATVGEALGIPQGTIGGARAMELTRRHVAAFADRHLWGLPRPVLDVSRGEVHVWPV